MKMCRIRFWMTDIHNNMLGDAGDNMPLFRADSMVRHDEGCTYAAWEIKIRDMIESVSVTCRPSLPSSMRARVLGGKLASAKTR